METCLKFFGGTVDFTKALISYPDLGAFTPQSRTRIVGANGTGKSTLCKCFAGVIPFVYKAKVNISATLYNKPLFIESEHTPSNLIGVLPQDVREFFFGFSFNEEWEYSISKPYSIHNKFAQKIYEKLELEKLRNINIFDLSDGEKQRVAIALFLIQGKRWNILDEWQQHLDSDWRNKIDSILREVCAETGSSIIEFTSVNDSHYSESTRQFKTEVSYDEPKIFLPLEDKITALHTLLNQFSSETKEKSHMSLRHNGKIKRGRFCKNVGITNCESGHILLILGRNGSGKTTLVRGFRHNSGIFRKKPNIVLTNPSLQVLGKSIFDISKQCINPLKSSRIGDAILLICRILNLQESIDLLSLNYASNKLLSIILATLSENLGLVVDEPFTSLDSDSKNIAAYALDFAAKNNKAVIITAPVESQVPSTLRYNINIKEMD